MQVIYKVSNKQLLHFHLYHQGNPGTFQQAGPTGSTTGIVRTAFKVRAGFPDLARLQIGGKSHRQMDSPPISLQPLPTMDICLV